MDEKGCVTKLYLTRVDQSGKLDRKEVIIDAQGGWAVRELQSHFDLRYFNSISQIIKYLLAFSKLRTDYFFDNNCGEILYTEDVNIHTHKSGSTIRGKKYTITKKATKVEHPTVLELRQKRTSETFYYDHEQYQELRNQLTNCKKELNECSDRARKGVFDTSSSIKENQHDIANKSLLKIDGCKQEIILLRRIIKDLKGQLADFTEENRRVVLRYKKLTVSKTKIYEEKIRELEIIRQKLGDQYNEKVIELGDQYDEKVRENENRLRDHYVQKLHYEKYTFIKELGHQYDEKVTELEISSERHAETIRQQLVNQYNEKVRENENLLRDQYVQELRKLQDEKDTFIKQLENKQKEQQEVYAQELQKLQHEKDTIINKQEEEYNQKFQKLQQQQQQQQIEKLVSENIIKSLQTQLESLKQNIQQHEKICENLKQEAYADVSSCKFELNELSSHMNDKELIIKSMVDFTSNLLSYLGIQQQSGLNLPDVITGGFDSINNHLSSYKPGIEQLKKEYNRLGDDNAQLKASLKELKGNLQNLSSIIDMKHSECEKTLLELSNNVETIQNQLNICSNHLEECKKENQRIAEIMDTNSKNYTNHINNLTLEKTQLEYEKTQLKSEKTQLESETLELNNKHEKYIKDNVIKIEELESENNILLTQEEEYKKTIELTKNEMEKVLNRLKQCEYNRNTYIDQLKKEEEKRTFIHNKKVKELQTKVTEVDEKWSELSHRFNTLEKSYIDMSYELVQNKDIISNNKKTISELNSTLSLTKHEHQVVKNSLSIQIEQARVEGRKLKQIDEKCKEKITDLTNQINNEKSRYTNQEKQLAECNLNLGKANEKNNTLIEDIETVLKEYDILNDKYDSFHNDHVEIVEHCADLETKYEDLKTKYEDIETKYLVLETEEKEKAKDDFSRLLLGNEDKELLNQFNDLQKKYEGEIKNQDDFFRLLQPNAMTNNEQYEKLQEEYEILADMFREYIGSDEDSESKINIKYHEISRLKELLQDAKEDIEEIKKKNRDLHTQKGNLEQKYDNLTELYEEEKKANKTLRNLHTSYNTPASRIKIDNNIRRLVKEDVREIDEGTLIERCQEFLEHYAIEQKNDRLRDDSV